jgi:putative transposase
MGRKGHDPEQIASILKKADAGIPVEQLCAQHGISARTFYRWKFQNNRPRPAGITELKQIEEENQRLKSVVAELILENRALKEELVRRRGRSAS